MWLSILADPGSVVFFGGRQKDEIMIPFQEIQEFVVVVVVVVSFPFFFRKSVGFLLVPSSCQFLEITSGRNVKKVPALTIIGPCNGRV